MALESFLSELLKTMIALFIIVDPFGNIPIFISLTGRMEEKQRRSVLNTATYTAAILLIVFALAGRGLLEVFNISIYSFMLAGGILLFILAVDILVYGTWIERIASPDEAGVVPMAFPLLAGPGAITTTIVSLETSGIIVTLLSVLIVLGLVWIILRLINSIYRVLGRTGSAVISKVMAVFIAAIAIQYVVTGVQHFF